MLRRFLIALAFLAPALANAADITGTAKVSDGDAVVIGNARIRLGGIDAPAVDQLCLNTKAERWTCGVAARDELAKYADGKNWVCHTRSIDRRGRTVALCEVGGEDEVFEVIVLKRTLHCGFSFFQSHIPFGRKELLPVGPAQRVIVVQPRREGAMLVADGL